MRLYFIKRLLLLAIFSSFFISCSTDEANNESNEVSSKKDYSSETFSRGGSHVFGDITVTEGGGNNMKAAVENYFNSRITTPLSFDFSNISKVEDQLGNSPSSA